MSFGFGFAVGLVTGVEGGLTGVGFVVPGVGFGEKGPGVEGGGLDGPELLFSFVFSEGSVWTSVFEPIEEFEFAGVSTVGSGDGVDSTVGAGEGVGVGSAAA